MIESMMEFPQWYQTYKAVLALVGEVPSRPLTELEGVCERFVKEAELDADLDQRIVRKIQAKYALAYTALPASSQTKRNLRTLLESLPPVMHTCDHCGKCRLSMDKLQPWERFECGSGLAFFPEKSCNDEADEELEWLYSGSKSQERAPSSELDVLAMAAASLSNEEQRQASEIGRQPRQKKGPGVKGREIAKHRRSFSRSNSTSTGTSGASLLSRSSSFPERPESQSSTGLSRKLNDLELNAAPAGEISSASPIWLQNSLNRGQYAHSPASLHNLNPSTPAKHSGSLQSVTPLTAPSGSPRKPSDALHWDHSEIAPTIPGQWEATGFEARQNLPGSVDGTSSMDSTFAKLVGRVSDKPKISALGRAVSDPHVLQRELARGIPPLEEEEPVKLATAAAVLRAGVDSSAYTPGRPLSRAISDPRKMQQPWGQTPAEAAALNLGINLPSRVTLVEWQAVVRFTGPMRDLDLFSVIAALPVKVAASLPTIIPLSGIRPRDAIRMDTILDQPLLLRLGQIDAAQTHAVEQMERSKIAVFAEFPTFDFVLVPHLNTRECLHVIGLRMQKSADIPNAQFPTSMLPLQRTVSAMPALDVEMLQKERREFKAPSPRRVLHNSALDSIPEDAMSERD